MSLGLVLASVSLSLEKRFAETLVKLFAGFVAC